MSTAANIVSALLEVEDFDPTEEVNRLMRRQFHRHVLAQAFQDMGRLAIRSWDVVANHYRIMGVTKVGNPMDIERNIRMLLTANRIPYSDIEVDPYDGKFIFSVAVPTDRVEILENDADIDPKEYALTGVQPKWVYHEIVFLQNDEAIEPLRVLNDEGADAAIEYLAQWDYGGENEHSPKTERPWGDADRVYHAPTPDGQTYFLTWNSGLGYIGLTRGKRHLYGIPD